jgi:hypothetical protein
MNVLNISQGIGGVATLPAQTSGTAAGQSRAVDVRPATPTESFSFTRLAWFDINGDGHIDPRAAGAGGDATLLVGSREVDLPTYSRTVHTVGDLRAFKGKGPAKADASTPPTPTSAQTKQAIDAYQRYGQAPAPATPTPTPTPVPASNAAPTPPVIALPTAAVATDTPAPAPTPAPVRAVA